MGAAETYRVWRDGRVVETTEPARFAGITSTKIFGRLTCSAGRRAKPENRVFFASWDDAVAAGFRRCQTCNPDPGDRYRRDDAGRWELVSPDK